MPDYQKIEDFVADDSFQQWVLSEDEASNIFWNSFIAKHPDKEETMLQAAKLVQSLNFDEQFPSNFQEKKVWQQIQQELFARNNIVRLSKKSYSPLWLAASVTIILAIGAWLGLRTWASDLKTVSTSYGEIRDIYLPDSSLVTLNGNSSLTYPNHWDEGVEREVWLKGEGFFEVKKYQALENDSFVKFTVNTSKLNIEVLGTAFNVSDRKEKTNVVLTEGSIALRIEDEAPIQMKPGERFAIQGDSRTYEKNLKVVSQWSSWKEKELIFHKMSLSDIATQLKDAYGYQLHFPSESIAQEKFTARMHSKDVEMLFPLIARSFNLSINTEGKVVKFEKLD